MTRKRTEKEVAPPAAAAVPVRRRVEARRTKPAAQAAKTTAATAAETFTAAAPAHAEIAALAYSYWVARGYQGGSPEDDWLRAERELTATVQIAAAQTA